MSLKTSRWPFLAFALLFAAPGIFGPWMFVVSVIGGEHWSTIFGFLIVASAFGAFWLNLLLPIFRPRELIFSTDGLQFRGLLIVRHFTWEQFDRASGGMSVTLHSNSRQSTAGTQFFIGPFWPGGSDRIMDLASRWREPVT